MNYQRAIIELGAVAEQCVSVHAGSSIEKVSWQTIHTASEWRAPVNYREPNIRRPKTAKSNNTSTCRGM